MANNNMPEHQDSQQETRLERSLKGDYHFDAKALFMKANQLTKANFASLFQACLMILLVFVVMGAITQQYITVNDDNTFTIEHQSIIEIVVVFIVAPLISGLYMMGANHARGVKTTVFSLFKYIPLIFVLALTQLVNSIIVQLGLMLLIVPGIYLWMATSFSLLLVVDKSLTPLSAIVLSCKVFNAYWYPLTGLFLVMALLFVTVPFTLGLSLIWIMPLYFSLVGLLYEELIGGGKVRTEAKTLNKNESSFDA